MKGEVIISLEDYNKLINYKETFNNSSLFYTVPYEFTIYSTNNEDAKVMINRSLKQEVEDLKKEIKTIKKMNLFEFIKFKLKNI